MTAPHLEPERPPSGPHSGPQGASAADSGGREGRVAQRAREAPLGASTDSPGSNWPAVLAAVAATVRAALQATPEDFALCPPPPAMETTMPDQPAPDSLAPFRALADQYAAKAAESTRNANTAPLTIRTANQGIAAGWRSAEFLLRHTLTSLDTGRPTPDNPATLPAQSRRPDLTIRLGKATDETFRIHLAQFGIDTPGCDCGHNEMGVEWHATDCQWRTSRTTSDNPVASDDASNNLVQVGWYCWRCHAINAQACRSDNVPIHVPAEWADDMEAEIARREDEPDDTDLGGADNPVASAVDENAAAHFILTTICERNGYRPPPPGIQITADDLARIDRLVEYGTPFGEAVRDVIGHAAWRAWQADAVLDQRINDGSCTAASDLRERYAAEIADEIYEYRERTMFWEESGGVTEEITRLAVRGAMSVRDVELEQLRAAIARVRAIHTPVTHNGDVICEDCSSYFDGCCEDWPYPYPCWTITNLDGPPPPPNGDEPEETPS